jgi:hypothetical protein
MADIVETAARAGSFTTLVAAVRAAGLTDTLEGPGPFTVFAPTDAAFAHLPPGALEALLADTTRLTHVLTYHVVPGKVTASDVLGLDRLRTLGGPDLAVDATDRLRVGEASVLRPDVEADNGVIHVIDTVLLPPGPATLPQTGGGGRSRGRRLAAAGPPAPGGARPAAPLPGQGPPGRQALAGDPEPAGRAGWWHRAALDGGGCGAVRGVRAVCGGREEAGRTMDGRRLRSLAGGLGLGALAFGAAPVVAPGAFGRVFGIAVAGPPVATAIRSVGVRDVVLGAGLWWAAASGGGYAPWLLARAVTGAGDALAVGAAALAGARDRRFLLLGVLALGAAGVGAGLYREVRSAPGGAKPRPASPGDDVPRGARHGSHDGEGGDGRDSREVA